MLAVVHEAAKGVLGYLPWSGCACVSWGVSRTGLAGSSSSVGKIVDLLTLSLGVERVLIVSGPQGSLIIPHLNSSSSGNKWISCF